MAQLMLTDSSETVQRLHAVNCLLEWMRSLPASTRKHFWETVAESGEEVRQTVTHLLQVVESTSTSPDERQQALQAVSDQLLLPNSPDPNTHQAQFAVRLRALMQSKGISQQELAARMGCSQPAISQLLHRQSRPQKKTLLKLADALGVQAVELWPNLQVIEALDAVSEFGAPDQVVSAAEATAVSDTAPRNRPQIPVQSLPCRQR